MNPIRTTYEPKPGPNFRCDWEAVTADHDPECDPIGYGATEAEAIRDLEEQLEERRP